MGRSRESDVTSQPQPEQLETNQPGWAGWLQRFAGYLAILLVLVGSLRIASTYYVYNHTSDEGFHIACGVEWLTKKTYALEEQHPPLGRLLTAVGPWMMGAKLLDRDNNLYDEGPYVLYEGQNYDHRLAAARAGILPMFWLAAALVWIWCRRAFGWDVALASVFLFTTLPAILAHSGLATTDMPLVTGLISALLAFFLLVDRPSWRTGLLFGVALAFAILAKFSTLAFFPASVAAAGLVAFLRDRDEFRGWAGRWRQLVLPLALGSVVALNLSWSMYRFSYGPVEEYGMSLPAPEFWAGIEQVRGHNQDGHRSWLLGEYSDFGFWYYYPVAIFYKLPIPFLALVLIGVHAAWRRKGARYHVPVALAAAILAVGMYSKINIGIRHVLPILVFFTVLAGIAAVDLLRSGNVWKQRLSVGLLAWMLLTGAAAHPDYLPYFNAFAGSNPEEILVDSDLDWGQDMKRLSARLKQLGATQVAHNPLVLGFWEEAHGFPKIVPLDPRRPMPGWNAVGLTMLKLSRLGTRERYPDMVIWTDTARPTERVGHGILLYYNPEK